MKALKRTLVILIIILLTLISFGGIFVQKTKFVENILPEYKFGATLTGTRNSKIAVSTATNTVIYDKEGNIVEEEGKETTTKEIPVNSEESLTKENYKLTKEIIEKRLSEFKKMQYTTTGVREEKAVDYYTIKQNEETGEIDLQISENDYTNMILQYVAIKGVFSIVDDQDNVLMDNSYIEKANVAYNSTDSGVAVYLNIQFNKEGTEKLKEISNTFVKTEDEEGKDTTRKITIKIDDTEMVSTYFGEEISNGSIQLSFGTASSVGAELANYAQEASNLAVLLNTGNLPVAYTIDQNRYVLSNVNVNTLLVPAIIVASIIGVAILFLIIKYGIKGIFGALSLIGYSAVLLLIIRFTNVVITIEGIIGILTAIALNYIFIVYMLSLAKKDEENTFGKTLSKFLLILIPIIVITLVFCFTKWLPIYSFGMTMFWGIIFIILYNLVITKTLVYKK